MEDFKEKLPIIIAVIIMIALAVGAYYFLVVHKEIYYTQIDNTKINTANAINDLEIIRMILSNMFFTSQYRFKLLGILS